MKRATNAKKRKGARLGLQCLLCFVMTGLILFPAHAQEAPQLLEPVGVEMDTAEAYMGDIQKIEAFEAFVRPQVEELYLPLNGTVNQVHVLIGQQVKAGDKLVSLDTKSQEQRLEALQKNVSQLEKNAAFDDEMAALELKILQVELEQLRQASAPDARAIALKELAIEEEMLHQGLEKELRDRELERNRAELAQLAAEMDQRVLYAPCDGRVIYTVPMEEGTYVRAYQPIVFLARDEELFLETEYISPGRRSNACAIYALINDRQYSLIPVEMEMEEYVSKALSGEEVKSHFLFEQPDEGLQAGQFAMICIVTDRLENVLLIPSNAVYSDSTGKYVYRIQDGRRERQNIKIGIATDWLTQVREGLEEGDVVYVQE